MTIGKIQFAPDYKSKSQVKRIASQSGYPDMAAKFAAMSQRAQWQQLKDAVIAAVRADRLAAKAGAGSNADIDGAIRTRAELNAAIDTLLAFEADSGTGAI